MVISPLILLQYPIYSNEYNPPQLQSLFPSSYVEIQKSNWGTHAGISSLGEHPMNEKPSAKIRSRTFFSLLKFKFGPEILK